MNKEFERTVTDNRRKTSHSDPFFGCKSKKEDPTDSPVVAPEPVPDLLHITIPKSFVDLLCGFRARLDIVQLHRNIIIQVIIFHRHSVHEKSNSYDLLAVSLLLVLHKDTNLQVGKLFPNFVQEGPSRTTLVYWAVHRSITPLPRKH